MFVYAVHAGAGISKLAHDLWVLKHTFITVGALWEKFAFLGRMSVLAFLCSILTVWIVPTAGLFFATQLRRCWLEAVLWSQLGRCLELSLGGRFSSLLVHIGGIHWSKTFKSLFFKFFSLIFADCRLKWQFGRCLLIASVWFFKCLLRLSNLDLFILFVSLALEFLLFVVVSLDELVEPEVYFFTRSFAKQRCLLTLAPLTKLVLIVGFSLLFITKAIVLCGVAALHLLVVALLLKATPWLFKLVILSLKRVNEVRGRYGLLILRLKRFLNFGSFEFNFWGDILEQKSHQLFRLFIEDSLEVLHHCWSGWVVDDANLVNVLLNFGNWLVPHQISVNYGDLAAADFLKLRVLLQNLTHVHLGRLSFSITPFYLHKVEAYSWLYS